MVRVFIDGHEVEWEGSMPNTEVNTVPFREGVFAEGPDGGRLLANRCKSCGQIFFPIVEFCLSCLDKDMENIVLGRRGQLYSYTIGHMASRHFQPPYAIGYVDMPEGVRIFAPLKMVEGKPFKVGMEMEVVIEELWREEEKRVIGYKFRPL
jgi:uncharacterized OB-fold protein